MKRALRTALREPLMHFFSLGAILFAAPSQWASSERIIVVTPGVEAELARHFEDATGARPTREQLDGEIQTWMRKEALYREALRRGLDRDDASVRDVLVDKMRVLAEYQVPKAEPSEAELQRFLSRHLDRYEEPRRYDFRFIEFPKADANARDERDRFERLLAAGARPASLGRPVRGGKLTAEEMKGRLAPALAARLVELPPGQWHGVETEGALLLVRLEGIEGGLPSLAELRSQLTADWAAANREQAVERVLSKTVARYHFERQRP